VLHLEFATSSLLPDGYAWHDFIGIAALPPASSASRQAAS
jgi:hypothetical protein